MTQDKSVENQVNQALDDSVEDLSPELRRRLNQIRINAVEKKSRKIPLWKLATALSVFFAVTLVWQLQPVKQDDFSTLYSELAYSEVLQEDLDMLNDLEFVYWMAEEVTEESNSALL